MSRLDCRCRAWFAALFLPVILSIAGCGALKGAAVNSVAGMLAETGTTLTSHDDPELIRDAVPFALTLYESILESAPKHKELLRATCAAYTQYAYAFVQADADLLPSTAYEQIQAKRDRALKLYLRGRGFCFRALELRKAGVTTALKKDAASALAWAKTSDVPLLYWTAASWGSAISLGLDKPELFADSGVVKAIIQRALALDEDYERGALHAVMISLEAVPEAMGGSKDRARKHFERAVELSGGQDPGPYVTFAASVSVETKNKVEFIKLLETAIAIDPEKQPATRLPTLIAQTRAKNLLSRVDELFIDAPLFRWSY